MISIGKVWNNLSVDTRREVVITASHVIPLTYAYSERLYMYKKWVELPLDLKKRIRFVYKRKDYPFRKNPGAAWHEKQAKLHKEFKLLAEDRRDEIGESYQRGAQVAHERSRNISIKSGLKNPFKKKRSKFYVGFTGTFTGKKKGVLKVFSSRLKKGELYEELGAIYRYLYGPFEDKEAATKYRKSLMKRMYPTKTTKAKIGKRKRVTSLKRKGHIIL